MGKILREAGNEGALGVRWVGQEKHAKGLTLPQPYSSLFGGHFLFNASGQGLFSGDDK